MASTAAIVFVKNDANDISWWIAYHLAVGFDALIIYDDHSTDGTWDIIQTAASIFPIETHRTSRNTAASYAERRSDAYGQAIESCRTRFDWVICLESDEYVYPEEDADIDSYVARFPQADGIMLSWSIFGSNNHVTRPTQAPIAAYTRRAPLDFADHVLGKTFIRPEAFADHFIDGCHWTLNADRYVMADGKPYDPAAPANWQGARILHYVTRNLAHYTDRLSRLASSKSAPDLWSYFNRNEIEDVAPQRFLMATRHYAARLGRAMLDNFYWRMRKDILDHSLSFLPDTPFSIKTHQSLPSPHALRYVSLVTAEGKRLAYDPQTHHLVLHSPTTPISDANRVLLVMETDEENQPEGQMRPNGFLLLPAEDHEPATAGAFLTRWVPVNSQTGSRFDATDEAELALFLPADAQWLAHKGDADLGLDAQTPLRFTATPVNADHALVSRLKPYLALRGHGDTLHDFCLGLDLLRAPHPDAIACAMAHLTKETRAALAARYCGLIPPWIAQG